MRTLTVSSLHREWGEPHRKRECVVPSIRLNGKWLAALGVESGQKIRVITNGPIITLAPVNFESELRRYWGMSSMTKANTYARLLHSDVHG
jgi:hypothetical protein